MIIDQLPTITTPIEATDELPIERGQLTYKVAFSDLVGSDIASLQTDVTALQGDVASLVRPNLLDNWFFVGGGSQLGDGFFPINQRGQTNYSTVNTYTIDRWKMVGKHTIDVLSTGIKITCDSSSSVGNAFEQKLVGLPDSVYTLSALVVEDTTTKGFHLRYNTGAGPVCQGVGVFSRTFTPSSLASISLQFEDRSSDNGNYITVAAIKLELGDTQTLAHQENGAWVLNEIPNYQQELMKCYRYFYRLKPGRIQNIASGYYSGTTTVQLLGNLGIPFKGSSSGVSGTLSGSLYVSSPDHVGSSAEVVTSVGELKMFENGIISGNVSTASLTKGNPAMIQIRDSATYIDFSADL